MSRYDELIDQNRQEKADRIAEEARKKLEGEQRRARYVDAFARALPEFHQALVRNGVWKEYEHKQKSFLITRREIIRCVRLQRYDPREYWYVTDNAAITDDGRYLLLQGAWDSYTLKAGEYYKLDGYEELSARSFAEHLCDVLHLDKSRQFVDYNRQKYGKFNYALQNDEYDEVAFQYFAFCLPK
ncbi:MAG: hypothetical protein IKX74_04615 [Erysipelotrichaceae bacterium]|nr:hypothetical protein [Erysipelotrichaceae bacterium]MBR5048903.1 hypothetical protein [Erysipelotrichaceae bacterium]